MVKCPKCGVELPDDARFCFRDGARVPQAAVEPRATQPAPHVDPRIGQNVGQRYRIIAQLGEGGMGTVYLARHQALGKLVAIKFLHEDRAVDAGSVDRFLVEARAAARLDHPNIVSIHDFGRDRDGAYYLVMEYAEGEGLHEIIAACGAIDQRRTLTLLIQVVSAAAAAHRAKIVHRDLKPENVIVTRGRGDRDVAKVLDFGLAKILGESLPNTPLTLEGQFIGTPVYVSPEQVRTSELDGRSDLYSIGVMAYEMLTGSPPFIGANLKVLRDHLFTQPRPISEAFPDVAVHPRLETLIMSLLSKKPEDRPARAELVLGALDRVQIGLMEELATTTPDEPPMVTIARRARTSVASIRGSGDGTTTARDVQADWILWESPELLVEARRLGGLWHRRISELAQQLWGRERGRTELEKAMRSIREAEGRIGERETEIALRHADLEGLDGRLRVSTGQLRLDRLDLVARIGQLREALGPSAWTSSQPDPAGPVLEPPKTGAVDLPAGYDTVDQAMNALHELNEKIEHIDRQTRNLEREHEIARLDIERQIHAKILEVRALQEEAAPVYEDLATRVSSAAADNAALQPQLAALEEVAQALQFCRSIFKSLE
jgi:serine/threonine protein kinase